MYKEELLPLPYKHDELAPVMSEETLVYHYDTLAQGYADNLNKKVDSPSLFFNASGFALHNIFFQQFKAPEEDNQPFGESAAFIERFYGNLDQLKKEMKDCAMSIEGSGWLYLASDGKIKKIKNHEACFNIILLIDWWEHAWALDYHADKGQYFDNIWSIIDWSKINEEIVNKV